MNNATVFHNFHIMINSQINNNEWVKIHANKKNVQHEGNIVYHKWKENEENLKNINKEKNHIPDQKFNDKRSLALEKSAKIVKELSICRKKIRKINRLERYIRKNVPFYKIFMKYS